MIPSTMLAARLHGVGDLRVERLPVPEPGEGEVLVRIDACGVCPTDARKFAIGVNDGEYPFNPGHEWVGRVVAVGPGTRGWDVGMQAYGDTYAGYAEYATIATAPGAWSHGALRLDDLPPARAIFVEPLADCLHAVHDQGRVQPGERVVVLGAGAMGLQLVAAAARAGGHVVSVEPRADRRALASRLGARELVGGGRWGEADVVVVTVPDPRLAAAAVEGCAPGGRVVLFAGFGGDGRALVDLNRIHYREIALVGSEWIGVPPAQRFERYREAAAMLASGDPPLHELVTDRVGLAGVEAALHAVREQRSLKTILLPGATG